MAWPAATRSRTRLAERFDILGPNGRQGKAAVAKSPAGRRVGPGCRGAQCGCSELGSEGDGIITDVLAGQDPLDGLLDGPDGGDHAIVEDARPGVGQQDLGFECQPVQRVGHPAIEDSAPRCSSSSWPKARISSADFGGGDRLAPAQAREERPIVVAHADVPCEHFHRGWVAHGSHRWLQGNDRDRASRGLDTRVAVDSRSARFPQPAQFSSSSG